MCVTRNDLRNLNYIQTGDSCVLASYGVAGYAFLKKNVLDYFMGYCNHYSILCDRNSAENKYNDHFKCFLDSNNISGYQLIKDLHESSDVQIFKESRNHFTLTFISENRKELLKQNIERNINSLLIMFINNNNGFNLVNSMHSITIGYDSLGYFMYDTNNGLVLNDVENIFEYCDLGHTFLVEVLC